MPSQPQSNVVPGGLWLAGLKAINEAINHWGNQDVLLWLRQVKIALIHSLRRIPRLCVQRGKFPGKKKRTSMNQEGAACKAIYIYIIYSVDSRRH